MSCAKTFHPITAKFNKIVLERISQALYDERKIKLTYESIASRGEQKQYVINRYVLLHRYSIIDMVGKIDGDKSVRCFLLHQISKVIIQSSPVEKAFKFDIDQYVQKDLA